MIGKRLAIATLLGAILGVFCALGVSQRLPAEPVPSETLYLVNAWLQRLVMGVMVGLAGGLRIVGELHGSLNALVRGALVGAFTSISFAFFGQQVSVTYLGAGVFFGVINDVVTTRIARRWVPTPRTDP